MKRLLPGLLIIWPYLIIVINQFDEASAALASIYTFSTMIIYILNIINSFQYKDYKALVLFNLILKIAHIPFYLAVFMIGILFMMSIAVPAIGAIAPFVIMYLFIIDSLLMITTSMYGINAIKILRKNKQITKTTAFINILMHLFFITDVISAIMISSKVRKYSHEIKEKL